MPGDRVDRRAGTRRVPDPRHALSRVRLRAGRELDVIDLSPAGALLEGTTRLLPGTHVDVHVTSSRGRMLCRARVIRCVVWRLSAEEVRYRGAVAFDVALDIADDGYLLPELRRTDQAAGGTSYPDESSVVSPA